MIDLVYAKKDSNGNPLLLTEKAKQACITFNID